MPLKPFHKCLNYLKGTLVKVVLVTRQQAMLHSTINHAVSHSQSALIKRLANWRLMKLKFLTFCIANAHTNTKCDRLEDNFQFLPHSLHVNRIIMYKFLAYCRKLLAWLWTSVRIKFKWQFIFMSTLPEHRAWPDSTSLVQIPHFRFNRKVFFFENCLF